MSYRVIEYTPGYQTKTALENSNMFTQAIWTVRVEQTVNGMLITCLLDLKVRPKYFFIVPLLMLNKKAIMIDLQCLKSAIEQHYPT